MRIMEETERRENPNDTLQFPEVLFFLPDLLTPITCGSGLLSSHALHFLNWLPKKSRFCLFLLSRVLRRCVHSVYCLLPTPF